jgi:hypothetical protein
MILSLIDEGGVPALACKRIGPPRLFEWLWRETVCRDVRQELLADRDFEFSVERAAFLTPGNDKGPPGTPFDNHARTKGRPSTRGF